MFGKNRNINRVVLVLVLGFLVALGGPRANSEQSPGDPIRTFKDISFAPGVPNDSFEGGSTNNFEPTISYSALARSSVFNHNLLVQGNSAKNIDLSQPQAGYPPHSDSVERVQFYHDPRQVRVHMATDPATILNQGSISTAVRLCNNERQPSDSGKNYSAIDLATSEKPLEVAILTGSLLLLTLRPRQFIYSLAGVPGFILTCFALSTPGTADASTGSSRVTFTTASWRTGLDGKTLVSTSTISNTPSNATVTGAYYNAELLSFTNISIRTITLAYNNGFPDTILSSDANGGGISHGQSFPDPLWNNLSANNSSWTATVLPEWLAPPATLNLTVTITWQTPDPTPPAGNPPLGLTCTMPNGPIQVGFGYLARCTATGGKPPIRFTIGSGELPKGITFSESGTVATLQGIPTTPGPYAYSIRAVDSGTPNQAKDQSYLGAITQILSITVDNQSNVYFISAIGDIHKVWWDGSKFLDANIMASSQSGMKAGSGIAVDSSQNVYYVDSDLDLHQVWWSGAKFLDANIMASSQSGMKVWPGSSIAVDSSQHVYYADSNHDLHLVWWGGSKFLDANIMASSQSGMKVWPGSSIAVDSSQHVYYVDWNGDLHQVWWGGSKFLDANVMASSQSGMKVGGIPTLSVDGGQRAFYVDSSYDLHQVWWGGSKFLDANIMASSQSGSKAVTALALSIAVDSSQRIYYVNTNGSLHQVWWGGTKFLDADIMASSQSGVKAVLGSGIAVDNSQRIYYFDSNLGLHQISWNGSKFNDVFVVNTRP